MSARPYHAAAREGEGQRLEAHGGGLRAAAQDHGVDVAVGQVHAETQGLADHATPRQV